MNHILRICVVTLLFSSIATDSGVAQAGKSGLAFLKLGVSGRGLAMGDAMSASVSGAASTYYNPAGMLSTSGGSTTQLMFMHKEWIQDTRVEFLGTSILLNNENAIGFSLNSTTVSGIEIRTRPGTPEGSFTARNFSLGASFAHTATEELRLGITGRFLYQKLLVDESSGFAIDIGAQYRTTVENLSIGAVVANLGSMTGLRGGKTRLPALVRAGPSYLYQIESISSKLSLASDILYIVPEQKSYINAGGELVFNEIVAARAGYQFGSEGRGLAGGLGVSYGMLTIDYAFAHLSADLGNSHTISLALNF